MYKIKYTSQNTFMLRSMLVTNSNQANRPKERTPDREYRRKQNEEIRKPEFETKYKLNRWRITSYSMMSLEPLTASLSLTASAPPVSFNSTSASEDASLSAFTTLSLSFGTVNMT
jgi:hypothetical protein